PRKLTKKLSADFQRKASIFQQATGTSHHLFRTLLTTFPPSGSLAKYGIDQVVVLEDLFRH
ncbi:MAG: hypothetical protein AAFN92_04515, partial [Bacteroidota bacterium]